MEQTIVMSNTEVRTIPIVSRNPHTGQLLAHAPGSEFIIKNSNPEAIVAVIVTNTAGNPSIRLKPIVDEVDDVEIDVLDTVGSAPIELTVSVEARNFGAELELNMESSSSEPQSQPGQSPVEHAPGEAETKPVGSTAAIDPGVAVGGPAVVGPEKSDGPAAVAEPGAVTQPGQAMQEPAGTTGSVADQEAEKARIEEAQREQAENAPKPGDAIHEGEAVHLNKDHPEGAA